jgi:hypothetical protein
MTAVCDGREARDCGLNGYPLLAMLGERNVVWGTKHWLGRSPFGKSANTVSSFASITTVAYVLKPLPCAAQTMVWEWGRGARREAACTSARCPDGGAFIGDLGKQSTA